ncbi:MAG TPA: hypothetical protein PKD72_10735, partial [Gemmatales bacterium]|nr:hypothetical protein [Gemmatales bacterium]
RMRSEAGIRSEIAKLFWNTGQRSVGRKVGENVEYDVQESPEVQQRMPASKLVNLEDPDVAGWARKLGPEGFTKLVRAAIQQHYPMLDLDTRSAATHLYSARQRLALAKEDQARIKAEVETLSLNRDVERELLRQAEFENVERRREITKLEADVEEALGALNLALGRELDKNGGRER